jgi:stage III sporulation protein AE
MDYKNLINEQLEAMDLEALEELIGTGDATGLSNLSVTEIIDRMISGKPLFDTQDIFNSLVNLLMKEVFSSITLGINILAICIIMALMVHLSASFGKSAVSTIGSLIASCAVIALCLFNFIEVYRICGDTIDRMAIVMQIILPLLLPLLIAMGGVASGGILNPVILGSVTILTTILQKIILPLLFLSSVFILGNSLADRDYVKRLAVLFREAGVFLIGISVTLFSGLTAIQGFVTESTDNMLVKSVKYSVDNFVPIVGGFAADSMDMVLSCTGIIKNSIGILGLIAIITLLIVPLVKLLAIALVYKVTAALVEPIGNKVISDSLNELGNTVVTLGVVVFLGGLLFIIFLAILIGIGTAS